MITDFSCCRVAQVKYRVMRRAVHIIVLVAMFFITVGVSKAQVPGTEGVAYVFSLGENSIGAFDEQQKAIRFFSLESGKLMEGNPLAVDGIVTAMVRIPSGYIFATGSGLAQVASSVQVFKVDKSEKSARLIFKREGERNQVTGLAWVQNRLMLGFFESKYFTKTGYLTPSAAQGAPWQFSEVVALRMGDVFDCQGDALVVGRAYGDSQGEDGDLLLVRNGKPELLPSYRGVRGVRLFGDPDRPSIVIGDGWHANYGQVAQARVSILRKRPGEARYALEIVDRDTANYSFSRFFTVSHRGKQQIVAVGNAGAIAYTDAEGQWIKSTLYTSSGSGRTFDMALLVNRDEESFFVVIDGGLRLIRSESAK